MSPLQLPKIAKQLATNVKAVVATPKRLEMLVTASKDLITGIPQGIAATEPPVEAAEIAVKGGDKAEKAEKPTKEPKAAKPTAVAAGSADADSFGEDEATTTTSPISAMVGDALSALGDAEVGSAMQLLGDADTSLGAAVVADPLDRAREPLPDGGPGAPGRRQRGGRDRRA